MDVKLFMAEQRITQIRNFVCLLIGIYQSRSVHFGRKAGKIPSSARLLSLVRRLSRFLSNPATQVRDWYAPIARQWLETQFLHHGEIRLGVDGTKIGSSHQLLILHVSSNKLIGNLLHSPFY